MFLITYNSIPPKMIQDILRNIPLLLEYKDLIYSSYLLYNIETGCSYMGKNGLSERMELNLGTLLTLWEQEDNLWHFYDRSRQEVFCYQIIEERKGHYLCFGWQLQSQKPCVYTTADEIANGMPCRMLATLMTGNKPLPIEGLPRGVDHIPSVLSPFDLIKALMFQKPVEEVFYERIAKDPDALNWCRHGTYLYPTTKNPHGFYVRTFN